MDDSCGRITKDGFVYMMGYGWWMDGWTACRKIYSHPSGNGGGSSSGSRAKVGACMMNGHGEKTPYSRTTMRVVRFEYVKETTIIIV
jgi:hypothetical protein